MKRLKLTPITSIQVSHLVRLYDEQGLVLDSLPYTPEFETIVKSFRESWGQRWSYNDIWLHMTRLRKSGKLIRKSDRMV